jgi:hypothetical protein
MYQPEWLPSNFHTNLPLAALLRRQNISESSSQGFVGLCEFR